VKASVLVSAVRQATGVKKRPMTLPGSATEDEFHIAVAQLLDVCLIPPTFYTTFPAGYGRLSKATSGRLRAKGMKAGMPDILVFDTHRMIANRTYTKIIGLELKVSRGSLSSAQRTMHATLQGVGVRVYTVRSLTDVATALSDAGIGYRNILIQDGKGFSKPLSQTEMFR
jgi:hypothetical protein